MLSEGSTVNLLKRGGQTQRVTQSIRIGNGLCDCQRTCTCKKAKPKRRKAKKTVQMSTFFPNQPVRLIPPQFKLSEGVGLRYANQPAVTRNEGNNPIHIGSNAYTAGAPNSANFGQYNLPAFNQLEDMYRVGGSQSRLIQTMDMNTPMNSALVSGNIPPIKSDPDLGSTGPRSESQTTKALKPESRTSHFHDVAAIATARNMGQNPVNAMAASMAASSGISQLRSAHSAGMKAYFNELNAGQSVEVPADRSKSGKRETHSKPGGPGSSRVNIIEEEDTLKRGGRRFM